MNVPEIKFPGGSKGRVNRAGENVRSGNAGAEDLRVIEEWRAAHRAVLNTFQAILRARTRGTDVVVAQRHKRKTTIFDKLDRFPEMALVCAEHVKTAGSCNRKRPPKTTENGHLVHSDRGHFSEILAPAGRFRLYCS